MSKAEPYDWVAETIERDSDAIGASSTWSDIGYWKDVDGNRLRVGISAQLLRDSISFDERGRKRGIWAAGRIVEIRAGSVAHDVIFFEGMVDKDWVGGALPTSDVRVLPKGVSR